MNPLLLHEFHQGLGARFTEMNGAEIVADYGDYPAEHQALRETAGVLDFSFRGRICLTGVDRVRFLHGQITNDVKKLRPGEGCYAALTTAKGRMESDLNVFNLPEEVLLDFEPGLTEKISQRLEKFIVADDAQIVDAAPHYGLLSMQGPKAAEVIGMIGLGNDAPKSERSVVKISDATLGDIYLARMPRLSFFWGGRDAGTEPSPHPNPLPSHRMGAEREQQADAGDTAGTNRQATDGFDVFVPNHSMGAMMDKLIAAAKRVGGCACGWSAFETVRIEAGIPRFGADMDETNLPMECGIESQAMSFNKGCYIGQEVLNRVHTIGHVNKELRGLRLADDLKTLPRKGDKLFHDDKEIGYVTSAMKSPALNANIALGYIRREANQIGTELRLQTADQNSVAKIVELPFVK